MWIIILIIVVIFIVRAIYIHSGTYVVVDKLGLIWENGSCSKCKNWIKIHLVSGSDYYTIKRVVR